MTFKRDQEVHIHHQVNVLLLNGKVTNFAMMRITMLNVIGMVAIAVTITIQDGITFAQNVNALIQIHPLSHPHANILNMWLTNCVMMEITLLNVIGMVVIAATIIIQDGITIAQNVNALIQM